MPNYHYTTIRARGSFVRAQSPTNTGLVMNGFGRASILLTLCVVIVAGMYVFTMNTTAVRGAETNALEQSIAAYERESEELSIRIAELDTVQYAESIITENEMEPIAQVEFIPDADHMLAMEHADL